MLYIDWIHSKSERQGAVNPQWVHASVDNYQMYLLLYHSIIHESWRQKKKDLKNTGFGP